jgi:hypothetical protein
MKQTVPTPNSFFELIDSAEIFGKVLSIVYGPNSKFTVCCNTAVSKVKRCKIQIEQLGIADKKIFAKILYGMDLQCQRFSKDCMICSNREDVDDSYLDWSQLIRSIELQTVCFTLPAQFNSKEPGTDNTAGDDLSPNGGGGGR